MLTFGVTPAEGPPYEVNLQEFADGLGIAEVQPRFRASWGGDFGGRVPFAYEIAELFKVDPPRRNDQKSVRFYFRLVFRFLDEIDSGRTVTSCARLDDAHGVLLQRWISDRGVKPTVYKKAKHLVEKLRNCLGLPPLFWPSADRELAIVLEDIDEVGVQKLYRALKKEAMSIKAMFREGEKLAERGHDPRGKARSPGSAAWEIEANHAWLVRQATRDILPSKKEFYALGAAGLNKANKPEQKHGGPAYLVPGMSSRGSEGIVGKLRWFHPSYHDTAVLLWLFMLGTGWNLETALGLDITRDWTEIHPLKPEFQIIFAFKGRSDREVFVPSLAKPEWHPYQLIHYMIERTAPLRRTVQRDLKDAIARHQANPTIATAAEVDDLERKARSPWLYHVVNNAGAINCFDGNDSSHLASVVRAIIKQHHLDDEHPSLLKITTGDARDAWIGWAYVASGHNVLIARLAAQHRNDRSLRYYLRRRRYRAQSEHAARRVQRAVFKEIEDGRLLDETRLRILVEKGKITPEQERRLSDFRLRTRLGMGCSDPRNPPASVAPNHVPGQLCRIQRCTGCENGWVFESSMDPLCRAKAELIILKGTIPVSAWSGSSFEDEELSIEETLTAFDPIKVQELVSRWILKLKSEGGIPYGTYPRY